MVADAIANIGFNLDEKTCWRSIDNLLEEIKAFVHREKIATNELI